MDSLVVIFLGVNAFLPISVLFALDLFLFIYSLFNVDYITIKN